MKNLSQEVLSEVDLLELLNIDKVTLDALRREKEFPYARLNLRNRVYISSDVLLWLQNHTLIA